MGLAYHIEYLTLIITYGTAAYVVIVRTCARRFYYDFFTSEKKMTDSDLKLIKKEMDKIIRQNLPLIREEVTR